ncbi:hypothetical protein CLAFUW4_04786 [Fulvia fulva]|uniref:Major facilitator superfamily transporter n=1 Tax=Passalora fulva TaxID=5499 RepID=A0A9Q8PHM2_PASFU|nr:uncharacterized protein CLAFUR5_12114 [Fulvia fulva]KAK4626277.1 hypothetical protein CLAFUR4_04772 [Fulvia fulva]KAK4628175.1 hypothetical protein CLAFUR0_04776 [Fulvia fulva]UJO22686.1 hypothetical protein CLAFUR5_12114 [Fulvia fulva]WPV13297.1 hypothetical protein CLAFUW4_04786 [Fulvia fulva]WPV28615.1 hypothetical protein CLAFUW7_04780 [Fulvia fulva]
MRAIPGLRDLNPLRLFRHNFSYQQVPSFSTDSLNGAIQLVSERWPQNGVAWQERRRRCGIGRMSFTKSITLAIASIVLLAVLAGGGVRQVRKHRKEEVKDVPYYWMHYNRLNGYYNGIRTLVSPSQYRADNGYNLTEPLTMQTQEQPVKYPKEPPLDPVVYNPYPDFSSQEYLKDHEEVHTCYWDAEDTIEVPDVYAYPGLPQHMPDPSFGSYDVLGLEDKMCFERFGRYAGYGFGFNESQGGLGPGQKSEKKGSQKVFENVKFMNQSTIDWGDAQRRCFEKNKARFTADSSSGKKPVQRQAYVLRTWVGYEYSPNQMYALRAMINELGLKSGGEYDVHFLLHVKNNSIPIWADKDVYRETLESNIPKEFWNMTTLWSEKQMEVYYPAPFPDNFANMAGSKIHGVYRSAHFPLQWFSQQHPEYEHFWNWEMDIRYSGHYYEFNTKIAEWAKQQPRKGIWERSRRFYIPKYHGNWQNFTNFVEQETAEVDIAKNDVETSGQVPLWGPYKDFPNRGMLESPPGTTPPTSYEADKYEWGVGEDADLMVFNPIFDPALTNWVFSWDISGYNKTLKPPPRRTAIITVARLSKRLLDTMHKETWKMKHTMFPEMWPPTVAMHHGLKAVYVPHPVYFDRDWDVSYMNQILNYPVNTWDSPFGWGEHNMLGGSFYYNSGFSGALWRRWLGQWENGEGGRKQEEAGTGRLCLRGTLHHPIKHEKGPEDHE